MNANIYEVYDGDNLIMEGTSNECSKKLQCTPQLVTMAGRDGRLISRKYSVKFKCVGEVNVAKKFNVFDGTNKIFTGTAKQVADKFGTYENTVWYKYKNNRLLSDKFIIKQVGQDVNYVVPQQVKQVSIVSKKTKFERDLDMITRHLKIYGNTFSIKKPDIYTEDLKKEGIEITYRYVPRVDRVLKAFWVLERV